MFRKRGCSAHLAEIELYIPNIYIWVAGHQLSVVAELFRKNAKMQILHHFRKRKVEHIKCSRRGENFNDLSYTYWYVICMYVLLGPTHNSHNIDTQIYQEDYFIFGCKFSYEGLCLFEYERDC